MTLIRRVLCFLLGHPWVYVTIYSSGWLSFDGRQCRCCHRRERKLGNSWLPAGKDWGWVD